MVGSVDAWLLDGPLSLVEARFGALWLVPNREDAWLL
jgi:hypothetical protein